MPTKRVSGKDALILLVEEKRGLQNFTQREIEQLTKQAQRFYLFLRRQHPAWKVQEIFERIIEDTNRELDQEWQDAFRVSEIREENKFATEINIFDDERSQPSLVVESEMLTNEHWLNRMSLIAQMQIDMKRTDWSRYTRAIEHMKDLEAKVQLMEIVKGCQKKLSKSEKKAIHALTKELNQLRFGVNEINGRVVRRVRSLHRDGVYIGINMWKKMKNRLNALLDIEKRYEVKEYSRSEDLLDRKELLQQYSEMDRPEDES